MTQPQAKDRLTLIIGSESPSATERRIGDTLERFPHIEIRPLNAYRTWIVRDLMRPENLKRVWDQKWGQVNKNWTTPILRDKRTLPQ
jgi:hypothetical protein